eukprot:5095463-Amphidinium_carterae.1
METDHFKPSSMSSEAGVKVLRASSASMARKDRRDFDVATLRGKGAVRNMCHHVTVSALATVFTCTQTSRESHL